jgi:hypothetical protein
MTEVTQKKGLSKGCLIGIIAAGVLLVMIIVAAIVLWVYWEDISKFTGATFVGTIKQTLAQDPPPGVDTVAFNAVCDGFTEKLDKGPLDKEKYAAFFSKIQTIPADKKVDSLEVNVLLEAVFEYYPELEDLYPAEPAPDSLLEVDSLGMEP